MVTWLDELVDAIREKRELPAISDEEMDSEVDEEVMSEELGKF